MIVRATLSGGQVVTVNLRPDGLTAAFDAETVVAYDRSGRLWSAFFHGCTFRRGLDGDVLAKWTESGRRVRRRLGGSEAGLIVGSSARLMSGLASAAHFDVPPAVLSDLKSILDLARRFDVRAASEDALRFRRIYKPIGILPPDQYLALVLQLTEGCSFNSCTFCTFYRDRPFHIKSPDEFRAHVRAVHEYVGESIAFRRSIFLADANALIIPQEKLVGLLDILCEEIQQWRPGKDQSVSLNAFVDGFSGAKKSAEDYAQLAARGLRRVYIGLESGHDPLLAWLNKPGHAGDAVEAARAIKAGGANVCAIVLLGAGGARYSAGHVRDTIEAINTMHLGQGDLIYFSEFVLSPGAAYGQVAQRDRVGTLTLDKMHEQRRSIEAGLRFDGPPAQTATYDIREFVY